MVSERNKQGGKEKPPASQQIEIIETMIRDEQHPEASAGAVIMMENYIR